MPKMDNETAEVFMASVQSSMKAVPPHERLAVMADLLSYALMHNLGLSPSEVMGLNVSSFKACFFAVDDGETQRSVAVPAPFLVWAIKHYLEKVRPLIAQSAASCEALFISGVQRITEAEMHERFALHQERAGLIGYSLTDLMLD